MLFKELKAELLEEKNKRLLLEKRVLRLEKEKNHYINTIIIFMTTQINEVVRRKTA